MFDDLPEDKPMPEVVRFYTRPVVDQEATLKEGRTVHRDGIYVHVSFPADNTLVVDRPVYEADKGRWPRHWLAFLANKPQELSGTMLSVWGPLSPALVEDYRAQKVLTVEQLAAVPDVNIDRLGIGARGHRQAAVDFLEAARSRAPLLRVSKELEEVKAQYAALAAQMNRVSTAPQLLDGLVVDQLAPVGSITEVIPLMKTPVAGAVPKRRRRSAGKEAT